MKQNMFCNSKQLSVHWWLFRVVLVDFIGWRRNHCIHILVWLITSWYDKCVEKQNRSSKWHFIFFLVYLQIFFNEHLNVLKISGTKWRLNRYDVFIKHHMYTSAQCCIYFFIFGFDMYILIFIIFMSKGKYFLKKFHIYFVYIYIYIYIYAYLLIFLYSFVHLQWIFSYSKSR